MAMMMHAPEGGDAADRMAELLGPGHITQMIGQAIQACWMNLPKERRNADELERQIRRIVERELKNYREDLQAFGKATAT